MEVVTAMRGLSHVVCPGAFICRDDLLPMCG